MILFRDDFIIKRKPFLYNIEGNRDYNEGNNTDKPRILKEAKEAIEADQKSECGNLEQEIHEPKIDKYLGSFLKGVDLKTLSFETKALLQQWSKMKTIDGKPYLDVGSGNSLWVNTNTPQPDWKGKTYMKVDAKDFTEENIANFKARLEKDVALQKDILGTANELKEQGVFKECLAVAGDGEAVSKAKLGKAKQLLDGKTGRELQVYTAALKPVIQDLKMKVFTYGYQRDQQRGTALSGEIEDNQNVWNNMDDYASAKTLAHLIKNFEDGDWSDDNEEKMADDMTVMVGRKLDKMKRWLDSSKDENADGYKRMMQIYSEEAKLYAKVTLNVGDEYEDSDFRNVMRGTEHASGAMESMSYEEAFQWTKKLMAKIDENDYQSDGVKAAYQNLAAVCQNHLMQKLAAERAQIKPGDTKAIDHNVKEAILCAKMFTDRGGYDIDGDLTNPDWAASMLKDSIDFTDLSMAYMEKQNQKENPLKKAIEKKKEGVLDYLGSDEMKRTPEDILFAQEATIFLNKETYDIKELSKQFLYINMIESRRDGTRFDIENCQEEAGAMMTTFIENSQKEFYDFFCDNNTWGTESTVHKKLGELTNMTGRSFTGTEKDAFVLLSEIEGFGTFDLADSSWKAAAEVAKVVAVIGAAIVAGIATGGAGFFAAVGAMGATSAASASLIYQKGFDDGADFAKVYGKEFAIGAVGGGIGKAAQGGRAAFIASRSGTMGARSVGQIMMKGGPRAAALSKYLDDAANVGGKLRHGSFAGELLLDGAGGMLADTSLNTAFDGGSFMDNLQKAYQNPGSYMGIGMGLGGKISPTVLKKFGVSLGKANPEQLNAVNGTMKSIQNSRSKLQTMGVLGDFEKHIKRGNGRDLDEFLAVYGDRLPDGADEALKTMVKSQEEFTNHIKNIDAKDLQGTNVEEEKLDSLQQELKESDTLNPTTKVMKSEIKKDTFDKVNTESRYVEQDLNNLFQFFNVDGSLKQEARLIDRALKNYNVLLDSMTGESREEYRNFVVQLRELRTRMADVIDEDSSQGALKKIMKKIGGDSDRDNLDERFRNIQKQYAKLKVQHANEVKVRTDVHSLTTKCKTNAEYISQGGKKDEYAHVTSGGKLIINMEYIDSQYPPGSPTGSLSRFKFLKELMSHERTHQQVLNLSGDRLKKITFDLQEKGFLTDKFLTDHNIKVRNGANPYDRANEVLAHFVGKIRAEQGIPKEMRAVGSIPEDMKKFLLSIDEFTTQGTNGPRFNTITGNRKAIKANNGFKNSENLSDASIQSQMVSLNNIDAGSNLNMVKCQDGTTLMLVSMDNKMHIVRLSKQQRAKYDTENIARINKNIPNHNARALKTIGDVPSLYSSSITRPNVDASAADFNLHNSQYKELMQRMTDMANPGPTLSPAAMANPNTPPASKRILSEATKVVGMGAVGLKKAANNAKKGKGTLQGKTKEHLEDEEGDVKEV